MKKYLNHKITTVCIRTSSKISKLMTLNTTTMEANNKTHNNSKNIVTFEGELCNNIDERLSDRFCL